MREDRISMQRETELIIKQFLTDATVKILAHTTNFTTFALYKIIDNFYVI